MTETARWTRRGWKGAVLSSQQNAAQSTPGARKSMRGVVKILATPYEEDRSVDFEDLAAATSWCRTRTTEVME